MISGTAPSGRSFGVPVTEPEPEAQTDGAEDLPLNETPADTEPEPAEEPGEGTDSEGGEESASDPPADPETPAQPEIPAEGTETEPPQEGSEP